MTAKGFATSGLSGTGGYGTSTNKTLTEVETEIAAAQSSFGCDTVRLQIQLQLLVGATGTQYDSTYKSTVDSAITYALGLGMTVVVNCQTEGYNTGGGIRTINYPGDTSGGATSSAVNNFWLKMYPGWNGNSGVIFDIFNEPDGDPATPGSGNWATWQTGMNSLITYMRSTLGITNKIWADADNYAASFSGCPGLTDSAGNMVYSFHHPSTGAAGNSSGWDTDFGNWAATHPVVNGEFAQNNGFHWGSWPQVDQVNLTAYLNYLAARGIGITVWTTMTSDTTNPAPTGYDIADGSLHPWAWWGTTLARYYGKSIALQEAWTKKGSYSWTPPAGITHTACETTGAGAGGKISSSSLYEGGGGGGGAWAQRASMAVTPGLGYTVIVGAGGVGGATGVTAQPGGTSQFSADGGALCQASGGQVGTGGTSSGSGSSGAGGQTFTGDSGFPGAKSTISGEVGGNGSAAGGIGTGGAGAFQGGSQHPSPGGSPGGGGCGNFPAPANGSTGADGYVLLTYAPSSASISDGDTATALGGSSITAQLNDSDSAFAAAETSQPVQAGPYAGGGAEAGSAQEGASLTAQVSSSDSASAADTASAATFITVNVNDNDVSRKPTTGVPASQDGISFTETASLALKDSDTGHLTDGH